MFNNNLPDILSEYLQKHQSFVETYTPQDGCIMFVFALNESIKESYVKPVLAGKYSETDRSTVNLYFPNDPNHPRYGNRLVLDKSDLWRKEWENKIGVSLPEGAEVWPKAKKEEEIYGYFEPSEHSLDVPTDRMKVSE